MRSDNETLRRLLAVGRKLVGELDPDVVLRQILEEARNLTGARYAALGVLTEDRTEIERFITLGIDAETHRRIGDLPRGRGVLGVLIDDPRPLRLKSVGEHPLSFGFPMEHPAMNTFLGVPIVIRSQAWGNLYLTEKQNGDEFTDADEDAVLVLAQFAATAIENARLYQRAERGRRELQQAVRGLDAARNIADAIGAEPDLDRVLELIVKRGRALVDAVTVLILLRDGDELVVAAGAGGGTRQLGRRLPISGSTSGRVLDSGRPARVADVPTELPIAHQVLDLEGTKTALIVPITHRGVGLGVLMAFDRGSERDRFTTADEDLMRTFAASAGNAVAMSRSVEAGRLRSTIAAAEDERRRWARELHDQTLQSLGGLRVLLSSASNDENLGRVRDAMQHAIEGIDQEIASLRAIISDLRPALLDDLGLRTALEALIAKCRESGLAVRAELLLPTTAAVTETISAELETSVYRLVQEALSNVVKHAHAESVTVRVELVDGTVEIDVVDDGTGFDQELPTTGFGLTGMRERVFLVGGTLELSSGERGTRLAIRIPAEVERGFANLGIQQAAS